MLTLTELLRKLGVVGSFVEFCGDGLSALSLADRATLSNMCPEYGATTALFPVDDETLRYLRATGRNDAAELVERYAKAQGLFRRDGDATPSFDSLVELDLASVVPSVAGPNRPQDRVALPNVPASFQKAFGDREVSVPVALDGAPGAELRDGSVVIAAITSCTNTSNPSVMVAAGLLARNAVARGLRTQPWVKTSLAPGSRVVTDYLEAAGLTPYLDQLGFQLVGYGCTTCIGNSGPLPDAVDQAIVTGELAVAAVLSGNRNFEGRIHPRVRASYLASPPLVVAYALVGRVDIDLQNEPLGTDESGQPIFLHELWPSSEEISAVIEDALTPELYDREYGRIWDGDERWRALAAPTGAQFAFADDSTYVREPSFLEHIARASRRPGRHHRARAASRCSETRSRPITSPRPVRSRSTCPAGRYLQEHGVTPREFNSFGSRRGNHEVMVRGTFGNIRLRNALADGQGGRLHHAPAVRRAALDLRRRRALCGRGRAARDPRRQGVRLGLVARLGGQGHPAPRRPRRDRRELRAHPSLEPRRMGVLPLELAKGTTLASLGLTGRERFSVRGLARAGATRTRHGAGDDGGRTHDRGADDRPPRRARRRRLPPSWRDPPARDASHARRGIAGASAPRRSISMRT